MGQSLRFCGVWALLNVELTLFLSSKPSLFFFFLFYRSFPLLLHFFPHLPLFTPALFSLFSSTDPNILLRKLIHDSLRSSLGELRSYGDRKKRFISRALREAVHIKIMHFVLSLFTPVPQTSRWYQLGSVCVNSPFVGLRNLMGGEFSVPLTAGEETQHFFSKNRCFIHMGQAGSGLGQAGPVWIWIPGCGAMPASAGIAQECSDCPTSTVPLSAGIPSMSSKSHFHYQG